MDLLNTLNIQIQRQITLWYYVQQSNILQTVCQEVHSVYVFHK